MRRETVPKIPTDWDDYRFDLEGYLILENAVEPETIKAINLKTDEWESLSKAGEEWADNVHLVRPGQKSDHSLRIHNVVEGGPCFEELIDHSSWIEYVKRYVDNDGLHIWMNFIAVVQKGNYQTLHAGGHDKRYRTSFVYHDNDFFCGNVNIALALRDVGPGDGGTLIAPGTHKSNLPNPLIHNEHSNQGRNKDEGDKKSGEDRENYVVDRGEMEPYLKEIHLKAGDALIFTDALLHGASLRTNEGERSMLFYRYSSFWTKDRFGYEPSEELVARLTSGRRKIIRPIDPVRPPNTFAV